VIVSTPGQQPRSPAGDVFPATQVSWIDDHMGRGTIGRSEINRHIMQVYRWPLRVYFMGTRDRWLGEPEDIVDGFFADRLSRPQFIKDWRASGLKLRHWLINAFCFYLRELKRARQRHAHEDLTQTAEPEITPSDLRELDRAYVASIVREALAEAERVCNEQGMSQHWKVFSMHFAMGRPYDQFVEDMGIDPARAVVMARTAKKKFQAALRELLSNDSDSTDIDAEIRQLLEGS
jgi:hypothetical protein